MHPGLAVLWCKHTHTLGQRQVVKRLDDAWYAIELIGGTVCEWQGVVVHVCAEGWPGGRVTRPVQGAPWLWCNSSGAMCMPHLQIL